MKKVFFTIMIILFAAAFATAADEIKQTNCPIMGGKINPDVFVDYKDMRIFFCCPGCDGEFMKDPEKHIAKMKADGVEIMKLPPQSVCPVSGEELQNKDTFADVNGKRIYTCCANCIAKVKEDPEALMKKIAERGEYLEDTPEK